MATDTKNIDLLQRFIDNEKKAKTWTLMSVTLFCLLAFGVIYLAWKLKTAQTTITSQQNKIEELNEALTIALASADSANDALTSRNIKLESNNNNYDSLQNITNSLLISLAEIKKENPTENVITVDTMAIDRTTQQKIEKLITPANIEKIQEKENKYTVYIQYADGYEEQATKLRNWWQKEYICPKPELITNRSFNASVNYFDPEDEAEANKLAKLVQQKLDLPVKANFFKMKAPKKQLELWLGKYQAKTTEQIFKKYDINKTLLEKQVTLKKVQQMQIKQ
jgi:FtsZ-binding cell division protein ZapB